MRRAITLIFVVCTCAAWAQTTHNFTVIMRTVGNHTFWDGNGVNIFGFSSAMSQPATLPARTLYCNEGDTVIITATNISQGEHHTIHLHGLDVDTRNDGDPATSFWLEHMQDTTYTFVATNAGTYLYHCHVADVVHVQMGMYGLIVVKAAGGTNNAWTGGPMYHKDYKWLMSEVDVYWHENVPQHNQAMDTVNLPPYQPDYFLINGSSQSQLAADDSTRITGAQGEYIYMRLANIGFFNNRVIFPSSLNATIIDSDGRPLPSSIANDTIEIMPGERYGVMLNPSAQFTGSAAVQYIEMNTDSVWMTENVPVNISGYIGMSESSTPSFTIYPNPSNGLITVTSEQPFGWVSIFNSLGQEVKRVSLGAASNEASIYAGSLPAGIYYLSITTAQGASGYHRLVIVE